ncbi:MAG: DUF411 domain-containing protein [Candidatus Bipolaricaulia bacterium]
MKRILMMAGIAAAVAVAAYAVWNGGQAPADATRPQTASDAEPAAILYQDPSCGCCSQYGRYLRSKGMDIEVEQVSYAKLDQIKQRLGVDASLRSCHTLKLGDYVVEGHVPMEAIDQLLSDQPDIQGIALPGMPKGSPGMNGPKTKPFIIYQITDDGVSRYMTL